MRAIIFYSGYLPGEKYGGPVSSLFNLTELLGDECDLFLVCTNHDLHDKTPYKGILDGWNQVGKVKVRYLNDEQITRQCYEEIIDQIKPDLMYTSSIFSANHNYCLYGLSNRKKLPMILAPRGELNTSALKNSRLKKRAYLFFLKATGKLRNTILQATSKEEYQDILSNLGVREKHVRLLPNVPAMPCCKSVIQKEKGYARLCFVGRIVRNKNAEKCILAAKNAKANITLDIFGPIEDSEYWESCKAQIESCPDNVKVVYKGIVKQSEMRNLYSQYDCLISPTEFENFGQAIVEALAQGTPVIISQNTTPWDDLSQWKAGFVHPLSTLSEFTDSIDRIAYMSLEEYREMVNQARIYYQNKFDIDELREKYLSLFHEISTKKMEEKESDAL